MGLRLLHEIVFVLTLNRLAARTAQMCLSHMSTIAYPGTVIALTQDFAAFAAALAFFLYARTSCSEPASTTSATDMCVPAFP